VADSEELSTRLEVASPWDAVLAAEPIPRRMLSADEFDVVAHQVANFIDMRSAYTVGHSPAVAMLAEAAARGLGLSTAEARSAAGRRSPSRSRATGARGGLG
jgi:HD-GYP domain-containing protein (c-di-GMP phosphodiesterase class II)